MRVSDYPISSIIRQYTRRMQGAAYEDNGGSQGLRLSNNDSVWISDTGRELLYERLYKAIADKSKHAVDEAVSEIQTLEEEMLADAETEPTV